MEKSNWKNILGALVAVTSLVIYIWMMEDRYLKASDFLQYQQQQQLNYQSIRDDTRKSLNNFRKQMLEDQLFELQLKKEEGTATNIEKARIKRIKRQLEKLN
jgi:hypothetical protein